MGEKARKLRPGRLIIASHNDGKVREINELVAPYQIEAVSAKKIGLSDPEETEKTFTGNALLKARAAANAAEAPALADDSGLSVAALGGDPGIYSARWAGEPRDFSAAMARVEKALAEAESEDRTAKFVCALALAWPSGHEAVFEGEVHGRLVFPPRGDKGFGYDPIFVADGYDITFGEMEPAEKHAISHRAAAFAKLKAACLDP
ncbi:MAG: RdgB/HAM1 family non-canonical purine NTP pyrophosphatase [Pseudomonadota bacterium]